MILKFKNRIAFYNTLAVAITTAFVFGVIYTVVHTTAYVHLDNDILQEKEEVFNNLDWHRDSIIIYKMPEWDESEHHKIEVNPTFLQIVDTRNRVVFHSSNLLKGDFLFNPSIDQETFYDGEMDGQKIRLGQFPVKNESGKIIGQLTIAISQQESYTILHNLILVLLISFPLVLIVQFLASAFAASRAIRPVNHLIATASGIGDSIIGTRLELPERVDELYELTKTINDLLGRIEINMEHQKQFTSDASHEIRTPLAGIRGTLEVLIRKPREQKLYEEKITEIIQQVDRIDSVLEQLLQLARIESGVTIAKQEQVDLLKITTGLTEKWKLAAMRNNNSIHFSIPEGSTVKGDKLFLELILDNLVCNAFKYGRENGRVDVEWNADKNAIFVKDNGIGISEEDLGRIFNRFYRTDKSRSSAVKGNGLGLSIVKKLADLQKIDLTVESKVGIGTIFKLQFPG